MIDDLRMIIDNEWMSFPAAVAMATIVELARCIN
jgi:hypothetical protein